MDNIYNGCSGFIWKDTSVIVLIGFYRKLMAVLHRIKCGNHNGNSGRYNRLDTFIANFIKQEALPAICNGDPGYIRPEDWAILSLPPADVRSPAEISQIEKWQSRRKNTSEELSSELHQTSILAYLDKVTKQNQPIPAGGIQNSLFVAPSQRGNPMI